MFSSQIIKDIIIIIVVIQRRQLRGEHGKKLSEVILVK